MKKILPKKILPLFLVVILCFTFVSCTLNVDLEAMGIPGPTPSPVIMVYASRTGSKYHCTLTCSNMKNPSLITEDEAISAGYEKCSNCW